MQIIVRNKRSEQERRKTETSVQLLKHYYRREIRDGARIKLPAGKQMIKKLYETG